MTEQGLPHIAHSLKNTFTLTALQVVMKSDELCLTRFLDAQESSYITALDELKAGKKRSHWMWYIFPQLKGLGRSSLSEMYSLVNIAEARAYLADPILGQRLRKTVEAMLAHRSLGAVAVLGELDALKFKSCLTLFSAADPSEQIFTDALHCFFAGVPDKRTLKLISAPDDNA